MIRPPGALLIVLAIASRGLADGPKSFPPPAPPSDAGAMGLGVQRTMTLLATSTPEHRNKVRILFYGQSITEQEWSKNVADDLRKRFPNADLVVENRAIGGFASQLLIRPAEQDLYPFYPDLLIFHVYGANQEYEEIIKNVRSRTTAEVLMQKDHVTKWPPETPDPEADKGMWWDHMMNHQFLPDIAKKYGCALLDIRTPWLDYLKSQKLEPKDLLKDGVHLNEHGNFLMAELVKRYLVYRPDLADDSWKGLVTTYEVGKDVSWKDGKLTLDVTGNRFDLLAAPGEEGSVPSATVLIDGAPPSSHPDLTCVTRPQPGPWSPLAVTRVARLSPRIIEDWTLKITSVTPDSSTWTFDLTGSVTGPDGSGSNQTSFTSNSGRVRLDPKCWFRNGKVPVGYEIRWSVRPLYLDRYESPDTLDVTRDTAKTVAQGIANGKHRLEITAEGGAKVPIRAIRVYRPPVAR